MRGAPITPAHIEIAMPSPPGRRGRKARVGSSDTSAPCATLPVHSHTSTGDAYDASNGRPDHRFSILLIETEGVVGLAWAWPIAVTQACGVLHYPKPGTDIITLLEDAGYDEADARQAVAVAVAHGFPVRADFMRFS